jgi:hypothetical protein
MPLVADVLKAKIVLFATDPNFPSDASTAAQKWADAVGTYCAAITPPSLTVTAAQTALQGTLSSINSDAQNFATVFSTAMTAFATMVGTGMAPAMVAVPPTSPLSITLKENDDTDKSAGDFAKSVDSWMKTGTATPSAGGPPVPWA